VPVASMLAYDATNYTSRSIERNEAMLRANGADIQHTCRAQRKAASQSTRTRAALDGAGRSTALMDGGRNTALEKPSAENAEDWRECGGEYHTIRLRLWGTHRGRRRCERWCECWQECSWLRRAGGGDGRCCVTNYNRSLHLAEKRANQPRLLGGAERLPSRSVQRGVSVRRGERTIQSAATAAVEL
jgi:hypothetical protein